VPALYGLRRGEIICADTPKEVTHRTADTPKEVAHSPEEVSSIRKRSRSITAFPNVYIERQQITVKVAQPTAHVVIKESLMKTKQKSAILELKRRHLKNIIFCYYTSYPAMKIQRISTSSAQETRNDQFLIRRITLHQYVICTAVHQSKIRI
nr:hypothetical protein [Tanacetum cinerariifolium]